MDNTKELDGVKQDIEFIIPDSVKSSSIVEPDFLLFYSLKKEEARCMKKYRSLKKKSGKVYNSIMKEATIVYNKRLNVERQLRTLGLYDAYLKWNADRNQSIPYSAGS